MLISTVKKIFGTRNDRELKRMGKVVARINALEDTMQALDDDELRAKTDEFRARLGDGETLEQLLPEAFAVVREAGVRALGMRHFDVQLIGGMALHDGKIAEMRTGEGKTLVATLPAYLNSLPDHSVHLVTVNDYLASRDAAWMGPLYEFLGLSVGVVRSGQSADEKRASYGCDVVYGTNNEFGFDYLRDNMAFSMADKSQGRLAFAIVDEVDSILIDEARTPLIISGAADDSSELYKTVNRLIPKLSPELEAQEGDYTVDEKQRSIELTEQGHEKVEGMLIEAGLLQDDDSLYAATNLGLLHHVHSGLRAHVLFQRDVEYIVQEGQVVLIDEHTGRTMPGRRLSEGLHQAIEAKEGVKIQSESQTLASTTFQNFFRLYDKLSGMTGTADTEAFEFRQIYGLDCVVIPTNVPMRRDDLNDLVYLTREEKFEAIIEDVRSCIDSGAPVLVGTASVETSEELSQAFQKQNIEHKVLNAKYHEQEAEIIAQAGRPGVVTIATNMAGRGTDIKLAPGIKEKGGLAILGTERHESRRIDLQLRGRSGRQGDPGFSQFYVSLEDKLMALFMSDRVAGVMDKLSFDEGEVITHPWITKSLERAQSKVEQNNFSIRKRQLEYDDVLNNQRNVIYARRKHALLGDQLAAATALRASRDHPEHAAKPLLHHLALSPTSR